MTLALIAAFNVALLRKASGRLPALPYVGEFIWFRNPDALVWLLIVAGFAMMIENRMVADAALNLLVVTIFLYFVQGMAIIVHFYKRFTVPRFARGMFYLVLVLQPYLAGVVAALGIFDIWGDFRTPKQQENL